MSWNAEMGGWWLICSKKISEPSESVACNAHILIEMQIYLEFCNTGGICDAHMMPAKGGGSVQGLTQVYQLQLMLHNYADHAVNLLYYPPTSYLDFQRTAGCPNEARPRQCLCLNTFADVR